MSTLQDMRPMPGPGSAFIAQPKKFEKIQQVQSSFFETFQTLNHGAVSGKSAEGWAVAPGGFNRASAPLMGGVRVEWARLGFSGLGGAEGDAPVCQRAHRS